jgi:hypothetical protein
MCAAASKDVPAKVQQEDLRELVTKNNAKEWRPGDPVYVIKDLRRDAPPKKSNSSAS